MAPKVGTVVLLFADDCDAALVSALVNMTFGYETKLLRRRTLGESFDILLTQPSDLIILGEMLPPNVNATNSLRMLAPALGMAPVLVVSAHGDLGSISQRMAAGAAAVISRDNLAGADFAEAVSRCLRPRVPLAAE
ncbi:MAG: hypothetical protein GC150_17765 [Rhizobiales bacterium]|nr:hypothetical protein [Hyphomicrobiales bacterium]